MFALFALFTTRAGLVYNTATAYCASKCEKDIWKEAAPPVTDRRSEAYPTSCANATLAPCVCVCVCVCARARARACACVLCVQTCV